MFTQAPVSSDGFILSLIDVMLIFSKPFTAKFTDYPLQIPKINCLYLNDDKYVVNASKIEKLDSEIVTRFAQGDTLLQFTGITVEPIQPSSLDGGAGDMEVLAPNFVTECFFLTHVLINLLSKKLE